MLLHLFNALSELGLVGSVEDRAELLDDLLAVVLFPADAAARMREKANGVVGRVPAADVLHGVLDGDALVLAAELASHGALVHRSGLVGVEVRKDLVVNLPVGAVVVFGVAGNDLVVVLVRVVRFDGGGENGGDQKEESAEGSDCSRHRERKIFFSWREEIEIT